jgi:hypothetical protein
MSATFVRHSGSAAANSESANSIFIGTSAPATAGHLLVLTAHWVDGGSVNISSITDTSGAVWQSVGAKQTSFGISRQAWVTRCASNVASNFSVTVNLSASTSFRHGTLTQFTTTGIGISTTPKVHSEGGSGAAVSGLYNTPGPNHLVMAFVFGGVPMTPQGSLTKAGADLEAMCVAYRMQATQATGLQETMTPSSGGWGMTVFTIDTLTNTNAGATVAPTIETQPQAQSVTEPDTATFSIGASGTAPLTIQWRRNGVNISGANATSYTTPATSAVADNGAVFSAVVSNAAGTITSNNATLTVSAPIETTPPVLTGTISVTSLTSTSYTVTSPTASDNVGVTGYDYSLNSGSYITIGSGARNVTISGRTPGATDNIRMRARDAAGNLSTPVLSVDVTLLAAAAITSEPSNQTVTAPATATFSVTATGNALTYQWQRSTNSGSSWTPISGATSSSYITPATSVSGGNANSGDQYRVVVTDSGGQVVNSLAATLTVNVGADASPPVQTGSITVSAVTPTGYTLSWPAGSDNTAVTGYEYSVNGGTSYTSVGNILTANITGRTPYSTDQVRVRAFDASGNRSSPALSTSVNLPAGISSVTSEPLENLSGSLHLNVQVRYSWFPLGRMGALDGIRPIEGVTTSHASLGTVTIGGLPSGVGLLMTSVWGGTRFEDTGHASFLTAS